MTKRSSRSKLTLPPEQVQPMRPRQIAAAETVVRPLAELDNVPVSALPSVFTLARAWIEQADAQAPVKAQRFKSLAEAVKTLRESIGLTVAELAGKVGVTRVSINKIENGKTPDPSFGLVCRMADAFGVGVEELKM